MTESNPPDDGTLLKYVQTGMPSEASAALEQLFWRHSSNLFTHLKKKGLTRDEQEDIGNETWSRGLEKIKRFEYRGVDLFPWLRKIADLVTLEHYKKRFLGDSLEESAMDKDLAFKDPSPGPVEQLSREEIKKAIREVLHEAPPNYREIIEALFFADLDRAEIAELYEWSDQKVYTITYRALKWLEKRLLNQYGIDIIKDWLA